MLGAKTHPSCRIIHFAIVPVLKLGYNWGGNTLVCESCSDAAVGLTIMEHDSQNLRSSARATGIIAPLLECQGHAAMEQRSMYLS